jgi:hypothetical protein
MHGEGVGFKWPTDDERSVNISLRMTANMIIVIIIPDTDSPIEIQPSVLALFRLVLAVLAAVSTIKNINTQIVIEANWLQLFVSLNSK